MRVLLEQGANPNIQDKDKFTALSMAVRDSKTDVALLLISDPNVIVNEGAGNLGSPLHIAVVYHQIEIIEALLKRGADPNFRDNQGCTPMHKVIEIYTKNEQVS